MTATSFSLFIFITIITAGCTYSQSNTTKNSLSFQLIPYEEADIIAPGRGAEQWHNGSEAINNPTQDSLQQSLDVYYRFTWNRLEGPEQNSYDWTYFDGLVKDAIDKGQKLSFGIMSCYGDNAEGVIKYDGGVSAYPLYLHNLMQEEANNSKDWLSKDGMWIPNWNSPNYLGRLRALHEALYVHIIASHYTATAGPLAGKSIAFKDVIYCIDVRGYGNYGEWHSSGIVKHIKEYPEGRRATTITLKTIIDHHTQVFDLWPLTIMIAAFDAEQVNTIMNPAEVGYYALTTKNAWGPLGWRRDQWGATDNYLNSILKNNEKKFTDGPLFKKIISSRFLTSPVTGEPPRYVNPGGPCAYWDLEKQLTDYGAASLGNGNWGIVMDECAQENARAAFKKTGYRIILEGGNIIDSVNTDQPFSIMLRWKNIGIAPTYEDWNVIFELKDSANNIVWSDTSKFKPKLFIPQDTSTSVTDRFVLPANIPAGNYDITLIIKDPKLYRSSLPLAITGRKDDGSYTIKTINISTKK